MKHLIFAAAALGLGAPLLAADFANPRWVFERNAEAPRPDGFTFRGLDLDSDYALSRAEAQRLPLLAANFSNADLDGDGRLSPVEFNNFVLALSVPPDPLPIERETR